MCTIMTKYGPVELSNSVANQTRCFHGQYIFDREKLKFILEREEESIKILSELLRTVCDN